AKQTSDGGFIAGGTIGFSSSSNGIDIYLLKLNSLGIKQWSRKYGDSLDDVCSEIIETNDGGYILAGHTSSFGAGGTDIYLMKLNSNGDTLWTKTYGGTNSEGNTSWKEVIHQTTDKGYIVGATTTSFGAGAADAYLIKTDSLGNMQWSKAYGGTGSEVLYDVKEVSSGGYVFTSLSTSFSGGINDFYVVRTNTSGDTLWTKTYGGANVEVPGGIEESPDKGFVISGSTKSFGAGNNDAYVVWTDSLGNTGCNQHNTTTIVTNCATIQNSSPTNKTFITLNVTSFTPTAKRGGGSTDPCVLNGIQLTGKDDGFIVFPNPNNGIFSVNFGNSHDEMKITLSNLLGEVIYSEMKESNSTLDLSSFANGIYLLKAEGGGTFTKQIIINK
ncbi:MAG: T9SS type A sorting domain-containing protein, partial [Bacteroidia bacterium]